jgi:acyl-coenzyme A thioesterase PaaI-like protein
MDDAAPSDPATADPAAPLDDGGDDRRRLSDEVRRVIRGVRVTRVGPEDRDRARALLAEANAILEGEVTTGPYWQAGLESFGGFSLSADPRVLFPFSPAMGALNPLAPKVTVDVAADKSITGEVTFTEAYNGPPFDTTHGGVVALVYDDLLGMAALAAAGGGMTARLTVNYRRRTPLFVPIQFTAWLEEHEGRKFVARGEMRHAGELLSEADGLFIRPRGLVDGSLATG